MNTTNTIKVYAPIFCIILGSIFLTGCPPTVGTVNIQYKHLYNFYEFDESPEVGGTGSSHPGLFGVYKITAITNTDTDPQNFDFSLVKIYPNGHPSQNSLQSTPSNWMNTIHQNISVNAGSTISQLPPLGCFVLWHESDPQEDQEKFSALNYNTGPDESVLMVANPKPTDQQPVFIQGVVTPNNSPPCN